jgi:transposase
MVFGAVMVVLAVVHFVTSQGHSYTQLSKYMGRSESMIYIAVTVPQNVL